MFFKLTISLSENAGGRLKYFEAKSSKESTFFSNIKKIKVDEWFPKQYGFKVKEKNGYC